MAFCVSKHIQYFWIREKQEHAFSCLLGSFSMSWHKIISCASQLKDGDGFLAFSAYSDNFTFFLNPY